MNGWLLAAGLCLLAGFLLVGTGVRRRRPAAPVPSALWAHAGADPAVDAPDGPSWTAAPEVPDGPAETAGTGAAAASPPPARSAAAPRLSRTLVGAGVVLVLVGLLVGGRGLTERGAGQPTITLPGSVLGLPRDPTASAEAGLQLRAAVPPGLTNPQTAVYGRLPGALLVLAAGAGTASPAAGLDGFRRSFEQSGGVLTGATDVDPGPLGGLARCWTAADIATDAVVCGFADTFSLVATTDLLGGGIPAAAERGRQVRAQTVHLPR